MSYRSLSLTLVVISLVVVFGITQVMATSEPFQPVGQPDTNYPESLKGLKPGKTIDGSQPDTAYVDFHQKVEGRRPAGDGINGPSIHGGPDFFGYKWDDSVTYSWVTTTTNSGITGDDAFGLVNIGFPFKFYEQVWSEVYVTTNGVLVFGTAHDGCCGGIELPSPDPPNNVIAPFSEDLTVGESYNAGGIFTVNGGVFPNRFFVIEWRDITVYDDDWGDTYSFQVVLHENGDITFHYQDIGTTWWGYSIGIEDSEGLDGLSYPFEVGNGDAVQFGRPIVRVSQNHQGVFTTGGDLSTYRLDIMNIGSFGPDTYDISYSSSFPLSLYEANGTTPLSDTDTDGVMDTGLVPQGGSAEIVVKVGTPETATLGVYNTAIITLTSSIDEVRTAFATLQQAVPTRFGQSFLDGANGLNSLYLAHPDGGRLINPGSHGADLAVAEGPTNFVYVWDVYTYTGSVWSEELYFGLIDENGVSIQQLTNHMTATVDTYDYNPAVAVAPDGAIGLVWDRFLYDFGDGSYNDNIYFAILDSGGTVTHGPVNITNIVGWGTYQMADPRITATGDDHFVLAWQKYHRVGDVFYNDIYYLIFNTDGSIIKPQTRYTDDPGNNEANYNPSLASLTENRVLLVHQKTNQNDLSNLYYTVLDSSGNTVSATTNLTSDGSNTKWNWFSDSVELSDGKIFITWMEGSEDRIRYAVLDSNYDLTYGPTYLPNPFSRTDGWMSVTADPYGNAVLTWQSFENEIRHRLFYSLINSNGEIITPPVVFRSNRSQDPSIYTSFEGYGNTTYLYEHHFPWIYDEFVFLPLVIH